MRHSLWIGSNDFKSSILVIAMHAALVLATSQASFAQGGSTGGSLGKSGQELSGSLPKPTAPKKEPARDPESTRSGSGSVSVSGRWRWEAKCANGTVWSGEFNLKHSSDGTMTGMCHMAGSYGCGDVSGRVVGNVATFTVFWADLFGGHRNPFTFTIADGGRTMQGFEESAGNGRCSYQARRF